ncbi:MAG: hypothetical protein J5717_13975 [Lachnospiraceae bacterium]|nr:hypothetical protein [Lachnospiraceae bacterium]MBO4618444.1 hypothetical protein [Lachnospiraceae bacterium]
MLVGNPYKFSLFIQRINEWNVDNLDSYGVILFSISGFLIPDEIENVCTKREAQMLIERLSAIPENKEIFEGDNKDSIEQLLSITFPNDYNKDNDYSFFVTPEEIADRGFFIFAVRSRDRVRILGTNKLEYDNEASKYRLNKLEVYEALLSLSEVNELVTRLRKYLE